MSEDIYLLNKNIFLIIILSLLLVTGCSKQDKLNNLRTCQESCLNENMSYNSYQTFPDSNNASIEVLKCSCDKYVEVMQ